MLALLGWKAHDLRGCLGKGGGVGRVGSTQVLALPCPFQETMPQQQCALTLEVFVPGTSLRLAYLLVIAHLGS